MAKNKHTKRDRVNVAIQRRLHSILAQRRRETGISIEVLANDALELGMRTRRWIPQDEAVEAEARVA